ncbi:MAG: hypothetical protein EHM60_05945, partial [Lysobacterales bacterium]
AIIGGDTNAIIGGDTNAIIGGDLRKSKRASIGGDTDAIIGGDTNAIIGGDQRKSKRAIIGGDTDAIIGGDTNAIIGGDISAARAVGLVAYGPIQSIDLSKSTIAIAGQTFIAGRNLQGLKYRIETGEVIVGAVFGQKGRGNSLKADRVVLTNSVYIPGVTRILVAGKIDRVNPADATLSIGSLKVSFAQLLGRKSVEIKPGQRIMVSGVQASAAAALEANDLVALD